MFDNALPWVALVVAIISGVVCYRIAGNKGHNAIGYGILGFFLPLIGIIVAFVIGDRNKTA